MTDATTPNPTPRRQPWEPTRSPLAPAPASMPDGLLDAYVERLIGTTVARMIRSRVIRYDDREDWEQEYRATVLDSWAKYDPTTSSWHTYASAVVAKHLLSFLRDREVERRHVLSLAELSEDDAACIAAVPAPEPVDRASPQRLVQAAIATLRGDARSLADAYMVRSTGHGGERQALGWSRYRYSAARRAIEAALRAAGYHGASLAIGHFEGDREYKQ